MNSFVFRETLKTHLLVWGSAYAQVIRSGKGEAPTVKGSTVTLMVRLNLMKF